MMMLKSLSKIWAQRRYAKFVKACQKEVTNKAIAFCPGKTGWPSLKETAEDIGGLAEALKEADFILIVILGVKKTIPIFVVGLNMASVYDLYTKIMLSEEMNDNSESLKDSREIVAEMRKTIMENEGIFLPEIN